MEGQDVVEETKVITLIYYRNRFNDIYRLAMLWNVQHWFLVGVRFLMNYYHQEALLVVFWSGVSIHIYKKQRESHPG